MLVELWWARAESVLGCMVEAADRVDPAVRTTGHVYGSHHPMTTGHIRDFGVSLIILRTSTKDPFPTHAQVCVFLRCI